MRLWAAALILAMGGCGDAGVPEGSPAPAEGSPSPAEHEQMWVSSERAARHTCPSERCGVVGQYFFRESARIYERRDGWARVTEPYSASCLDGQSEYVDRGNARCDEANGVVRGEFAEWVRLDRLSDQRPPDPAEGAAAHERLVAQSDDFGRYRAAFVRAANTLIEDGRCTPADFEQMGGWVKSSNHRDQPIYFTYCGGLTISNRIYLDAATGRIFS